MYMECFRHHSEVIDRFWVVAYGHLENPVPTSASLRPCFNIRAMRTQKFVLVGEEDALMSVVDDHYDGTTVRVYADNDIAWNIQVVAIMVYSILRDPHC
jgi:hypothetical protein